VERILAIAGFIAIVTNFVFFPIRMTSDSMSPTLQGTSWESGDTIWVETISYSWRRPQRWEVIVFRQPDGTAVAKRVVGLPGERIKMLRFGKLVINEEPTPLPAYLGHIKHIAAGKIVAGATYECDNGYFVLGDDAHDSDDSRFNGEVKPRQIIGRAWFIGWPRTRMGWVR
jgi:signal peptidase I